MNLWSDLFVNFMSTSVALETHSIFDCVYPRHIFCWCWGIFMFCFYLPTTSSQCKANSREHVDKVEYTFQISVQIFHGNSYGRDCDLSFMFAFNAHISLLIIIIYVGSLWKVLLNHTLCKGNENCKTFDFLKLKDEESEINLPENIKGKRTGVLLSLHVFF